MKEENSQVRKKEQAEVNSNKDIFAQITNLKCTVMPVFILSKNIYVFPDYVPCVRAITK